MFWLDVTWQNGLRIAFTAFLAGAFWTAGCWGMAKLLGVVNRAK